MRSRHLTPALFVPLLLALPIGLAACGGDDDAGAETTVVTDLDLEPIENDDPVDGSVDGTGGDTGDGAPPDEPVGSPDKPSVEVPDEIPTDLVVTELIEGSGRAAADGDTVVVDYVGVRTVDGDEFDNSWDRGVPFSVRLGEGRVIAGWDQGLVGAQSGSRRQLDIPAELAYGDNPQGGSIIQPGDALSFVVDVRAVIASVDPEDAPDLSVVEPSNGRSDLGIVDVQVGDGPEVTEGQTAIAHLILLRGDDLEVLESTWNFDDPAQIVLSPGGAIDGLVDGLIGMQVGGVRILTMPPALAFGPEGVPEAGLPGDVDVIIVAELVGRY